MFQLYISHVATVIVKRILRGREKPPWTGHMPCMGLPWVRSPPPQIALPGLTPKLQARSEPEYSQVAQNKLKQNKNPQNPNNKNYTSQDKLSGEYIRSNYSHFTYGKINRNSLKTGPTPPTPDSGPCRSAWRPRSLPRKSHTEFESVP